MEVLEQLSSEKSVKKLTGQFYTNFGTVNQN
jgi:hypothetical protein